MASRAVELRSDDNADTVIRLSFPHLMDEHGFGSFEVAIEADGLSCNHGVWTLRGDGLAGFLGDLANDWRGWEGIRTWDAIEHGMGVEADSPGKPSRVALHRPPRLRPRRVADSTADPARTPRVTCACGQGGGACFRPRDIPEHSLEETYTRPMEHPKPGLWQRFLRFFGLRKPPPDSGVREPRRPKPSASGGVATLEPPETDERTP